MSQNRKITGNTIKWPGELEAPSDATREALTAVILGVADLDQKQRVVQTRQRTVRCADPQKRLVPEESAAKQPNWPRISKEYRTCNVAWETGELLCTHVNAPSGPRADCRKPYCPHIKEMRTRLARKFGALGIKVTDGRYF